VTGLNRVETLRQREPPSISRSLFAAFVSGSASDPACHLSVTPPVGLVTQPGTHQRHVDARECHFPGSVVVNFSPGDQCQPCSTPSGSPAIRERGKGTAGFCGSRGEPQHGCCHCRPLPVCQPNADCSRSGSMEAFPPRIGCETASVSPDRGSPSRERNHPTSIRDGRPRNSRERPPRSGFPPTHCLRPMAAPFDHSGASADPDRPPATRHPGSRRFVHLRSARETCDAHCSPRIGPPHRA